MDGNNNYLGGAKITVDSIKHEIHAGDEGDYWRLLVPGEYLITANAVG